MSPVPHDGRPADARGPELVDAAARATVTTDLDRTLFVEAGAGSGKTSSLVDRIVSLVRDGVRIDSIAAITFTEAAASELRHRVRDTLRSEGERDRNELLLEAATGTETAPISTLHGFARRLLQQYPVEAGLPPGFEVVDEISSILEFDEAWRIFVGRIGDDLELLDLQSRASVLRLQLRHFPEVARRFDDNWDLLETVELAPPPLSAIDFDPLLTHLSDVAGLADHCPFADDKLALALGAMNDQLDSIRQADPLNQIKRLQHFTWPKRNVGKKGNWTEPSIDAVRAELEDARTTVSEALGRLSDEVLKHYLALVAEFVAERVAVRQARGELSFHDLLVLARRLLRSNEEVRFRLHQQYARLLLDEFQDTDPIQIELAVLLASGEPVGDEPWEVLAERLPPGRLVVVGDPKQSIYRFRRADMAVYSQSEKRLVSEPTKLTTNFRSVPGVVGFVNHLFGNAIGEGVHEAQPAYTPLTPNREAQDGDGGAAAVVVLGGPHDDKQAGEMRQLEAADIAAFICRAIGDDQRQVFRDGQWRPVRLQDIAVLIPSRLSLPALESAFGAVGLPFRPETSSLVYATQEVKEVLAGVRAAVDPANSVDVVGAIRSSLFAIGDDLLLSWKLAEGSWDYRATIPSNLVDHPVAAAFAELNAWHEQRWWMEPSSLIEHIVRTRRLREQALASSRPRDRWRRYRFLSDQAREFSAVQGGDLHDFVRWAEIQASDLARVTEPIPSEPDDDAVRILTIHGSKGLEFPITVLAGASTAEQSRNTGPTVLFSDAGEPEVKLGKDRVTAGFDVHASVEEVLDRHERIRLHYVAATRARDLLVVSAHHKAKSTSMGRRTHDALEDCPVAWESFAIRGDESYEVVPPTQLRLESSDYEGEVRRWTEQQNKVVSDATATGSRSATGIATALAAHDGNGDEPDAERQPWRRGRAGTAIGSAVHAVLQHIDLATGDGLDDMARLHAEREGIGELAERVAELVRSALSAPTITQSLAGRSWRELHVAAPVGSQVLEGYVDLLIETDDGLTVVDFKTDPVRSEADADRLLEGYRLQGAAYALALAEVTGQPVVDCRFLFLALDGVVERSVEDLPGAMSEVRQALEAGT